MCRTWPGSRTAPAPAPAPGTQWLSVIEAPRGRHSEKPPFRVDGIERLLARLKIAPFSLPSLIVSVVNVPHACQPFAGTPTALISLKLLF